MSFHQMLSHFSQNENALTCAICIDLVTDIDEFLTSDTTEDQIVQFVEQVAMSNHSHDGSHMNEKKTIFVFQLCKALGTILPDFEVMIQHVTNFVKQVKCEFFFEKNNKITQATINKNTQATMYKNTQATCNALVESQLPAIIDGLVNSYKKPLFSVMIVITIIENNDNFQVWSTTTSTRRRFVQTSLPVHK